MTRAYIAVGSNIQPRRHIADALERLAAQVSIEAVSAFYRTAPLDRPEQEDFLNGVLAADTGLLPRELKFETLRPIEAALGRVRTEDKYAPRTIDLDLLVYGDLVMDEPGLVLPDPEVLERVFLLWPLLEVAPDLVWPGTGRPLSEWTNSGAAHEMRVDAAFTDQMRERWSHEP